MRILVLTASVGSGHMRAAQAVVAALNEAHPKADVETLDVLELASPMFRSAYGKGYLKLADSAPHLLGYLYETFDGPKPPAMFSDAMRRGLQSWSLRAFVSFLKAGKWDAIVNTHFLPAEIFGALRREGKLSTPQATVVTDIDAHRFWAQSPCERYFVASEEAALALERWGTPFEKISVTGIPIDPAFSRLPSRRSCLAEHGLMGNRPVVLQLSGGSGLGPVEEVYDALLRVETPIDLVVVAGRNRDARYRLLRRMVPSRHRVRVLGFTDRMHELMRAADLIVSKPGGLTVSEALACGTPMVVLNPIPGQESRNGDFLLENGAAIKAHAAAALPAKVAALLEDPIKLARLRENAVKLGRPVAAFDVAREVVALARTPILYSSREAPAGGDRFGVVPSPAAGFGLA